MEVLKFGGSSVSSEESLKNMIKIIGEYDLNNEPLIIVVSALKGITNELVKLTSLLANKDQEYVKTIAFIFEKHKSFIHTIFEDEPFDLFRKMKQIENDLVVYVSSVLKTGRLSDKNYDKIVSFGELFSAQIITAYLKSNGFDFCFKDAKDLIITDDSFSSAKVNWDLTSLITKSFFSESKQSYVVSGFIARSIYGDTTTLGRGGSDYTATVLGAILKADRVTKWTDVNGIMTADPNKVVKATPLENITFDELKNLSKFGSNVLVHPDSINELSKHNIPFLIRNTFNRNFTGTQVLNQNISSKRALSLHESCVLVGFERTFGIPKELMKEIIDKNYLFFRVKRPENKEKTYYVVSDECLSFFNANTEDLSPNVDVIDENIMLVTITGENMKKKKELKQIKKVLEGNKIEVLGLRRFYNSISLILGKKDFELAMVLIHEEITKITSGLESKMEII